MDRMEGDAQVNDAVAAQRDAFVERLLKSAAGVFDTFSNYLGDRLGFYRALAAEGWLTSAELAARTRTVMRADTLRRYAAEAGFREVDVLPIEHFFFRLYRLHP